MIRSDSSLLSGFAGFVLDDFAANLALTKGIASRHVLAVELHTRTTGNDGDELLSGDLDSTGTHHRERSVGGG